jgi:hypothetical protein
VIQRLCVLVGGVALVVLLLGGPLAAGFLGAGWLRAGVACLATLVLAGLIGREEGR